MARHTKEFYVAMDAFLYSEMVRHQEDIDAIIAKRKVLHDLGYSSEEPAPWINTEDIEPTVIKTSHGDVKCTGCGNCKDGHECIEDDDTLTYIW